MSGFVINPYSFGGGGGASLTMPLLVTWEAGGDNTQTFVNEGTATGTVQWNGGTAKRDLYANTANGSSYSLDTRFSNDSVRYHGISGMSFGTQDFTWEAFIRNDDTSFSSNQLVCTDIVDSSNAVIVRTWIGGDSNRSFRFQVGSQDSGLVGGVTTMGVYYHLCVERTGDTVKCYKDGTLVSTLTLGTDEDLGDADEVWWGERYDGGFDQRGTVDDTRIVLGGNVYGSAFTVPGQPLTDPT